MDPRTVARLQALGRLAIGSALVAVPGRAAAGWIGEDARRPTSAVLAAALGARDAAIGAGVLATAGSDPRAWVLAGVASDAVDLIATLRAAGDLPAMAVASVSAIAAGSTALGVWLAAQDAW